MTHASSGPGGGAAESADGAPDASLPAYIAFLSSVPKPATSFNDNCSSSV